MNRAALFTSILLASLAFGTGAPFLSAQAQPESPLVPEETSEVYTVVALDRFAQRMILRPVSGGTEDQTGGDLLLGFDDVVGRLDTGTGLPMMPDDLRQGQVFRAYFDVHGNLVWLVAMRLTGP
jgi:hypothetical protein